MLRRKEHTNGNKTDAENRDNGTRNSSKSQRSDLSSNSSEINDECE